MAEIPSLASGEYGDVTCNVSTCHHFTKKIIILTFIKIAIIKIILQ
jgi:hypothetical protein